jgi:glycosyltransferase 2 family protein
MSPNRKHLALSIGIALSALFLWVALRDVNMSELGESLRKTKLIWTIPFVASLGAFCWFKSWRWSLLLAPARESRTRELFAPVIIGYMGTGLMPMQLGEVARAYLAAKSLRVRMAPIMSSLVVERVFDILALLIVLGIVSVTASEFALQYRAAGGVCFALAAFALLMLWLYAAHTEKLLKIVRTCTKILPASWRTIIVDQFEAGALGAQAVRSASMYVKVGAVTLLQWGFMCACTWISLAAVGLSLPWAAAGVVLATTILSMTLPSGPGYVGTLQLAYVLALSSFDVARSEAIAASVFYLVSLWVPLVAGGALLLVRMGMTLADLKDERLTDAHHD